VGPTAGLENLIAIFHGSLAEIPCGPREIRRRSTEPMTISSLASSKLSFYGLNHPGARGQSRFQPSCAGQFGHSARAISVWHAIWHEFDRRFLRVTLRSPGVHFGGLQTPVWGWHMFQQLELATFALSLGALHLGNIGLYSPAVGFEFDPVLGRS